MHLKSATNGWLIRIKFSLCRVFTDKQAHAPARRSTSIHRLPRRTVAKTISSTTHPDMDDAHGRHGIRLVGLCPDGPDEELFAPVYRVDVYHVRPVSRDVCPGTMGERAGETGRSEFG